MLASINRWMDSTNKMRKGCYQQLEASKQKMEVRFGDGVCGVHGVVEGGGGRLAYLRGC